MRTPFCLSYTEFENNYYNLLQEWFEDHLNTSEQDFLKHLAKMYRPFVHFNATKDTLQINDLIDVKNCYFSNHGNFGISFSENGTTTTQLPVILETKKITLMEYAQCVLDKIHLYFQQNDVTMKESESILDYINSEEIICMKEIGGYRLDYVKHQQLLPFLSAFLPKFGNTVDISQYRNFFHSAAKIVDAIDAKLESVDAFEDSIFWDLKAKSIIKNQIYTQNFLATCN